MTFVQHLKSFDDMIDYTNSLDIASIHEVYYPSGDASKFKVIQNDNTSNEVCTVSDKYSILQHKDAINLILSGIESAGITGGGTLRNYGNNIIAECYFDNLTIRDHSQDGHINLGMKFSNSFNKSLGFNSEAYGWRQSCSNGMLARKLIPNAPYIAFKHIGDVVERISNSVKTFVENVIKMEGTLLQIFNDSRNEIITFESHDQLIKFTSEFVGSEKRAKQIFEIEPIELRTSTWDLYNALTSYASHENKLSYNQFNTIHEGAQNLLLTKPVLPLPLLTV